MDEKNCGAGPWFAAVQKHVEDGNQLMRALCTGMGEVKAGLDHCAAGQAELKEEFHRFSAANTAAHATIRAEIGEAGTNAAKPGVRALARITRAYWVWGTVVALLSLQFFAIQSWDTLRPWLSRLLGQ